MKDRSKRRRERWSLAGFRVRAYPAAPHVAVRVRGDDILERPALLLPTDLRITMRNGMPHQPFSGPLYATGARTWTVEKRHAFLFTTCSSGPYKDAEKWARAHMAELRRRYPDFPQACAKTTKLKLVAVYVRPKRKAKAM